MLQGRRGLHHRRAGLDAWQRGRVDLLVAQDLRRIAAALLGLTDEAARIMKVKLANSNAAYRWPATWGPNFDWSPDQCHGGNLMASINYMLLQQAAQQYRAEDREKFIEYVRSEPLAAAQLRAPLYEDKVVDFLFAKADVTERAGIERYAQAAQQEFGAVDCFFNNAGILGAMAPLLQYPEDMFDKVMAVNVKGVFLGVQNMFKAMQARGGGSIIITSSVAGIAT